MGVVLLLLALGAGLVFIPFGLPGLWVMVGAVALYAWLDPAGPIGWWTIGVSVTLAVTSELAEWFVTGRATRRAGGSARGAWWALFGSVIGAFLGVPVPVAGSLIGAFLGAFAGAWLGELSLGRDTGSATRAAAGALVGRAAAVALKIGAGVAVTAWVVWVLVFYAAPRRG